MFDVLNSLKNIEVGHFTRWCKLPHSTLHTRYGSPLSGDTSATGGSGTQLVVWCRGDVQQDGSACSSIRLSADEYHLILTQNVFVDCATKTQLMTSRLMKHMLADITRPAL